MSDIVAELRSADNSWSPEAFCVSADVAERGAAEIEKLRAALKPFAEADWYVDGHGKFDGKISGADLDRAKALNQQRQDERK